MSRSSLTLSSLRAFVIRIERSFHADLARIVSLPASVFPCASLPYQWRAFRIVFSIVLVTVQSGLYFSFGRMVTTMIDHAPADLWIVPRGTKCFEDPSLLDERERFRALSVDGVTQAIAVLIGFAQWRKPAGG